MCVADFSGCVEGFSKFRLLPPVQPSWPQLFTGFRFHLSFHWGSVFLVKGRTQVWLPEVILTPISSIQPGRSQARGRDLGEVTAEDSQGCSPASLPPPAPLCPRLHRLPVRVSRPFPFSSSSALLQSRGSQVGVRPRGRRVTRGEGRGAEPGQLRSPRRPSPEWPTRPQHCASRAPALPAPAPPALHPPCWSQPLLCARFQCFTPFWQKK